MEKHIVHQNATSPDLFKIFFDTIKAIEQQIMKSY